MTGREQSRGEGNGAVGTEGRTRTLGISRGARDVGDAAALTHGEWPPGPAGRGAGVRALRLPWARAWGVPGRSPHSAFAALGRHVREPSLREGKRFVRGHPALPALVWGVAGSHVSPGVLSPSLSGRLLAPRTGSPPEAKVACLPARYKLVELLCYVVMGLFPALVVLSMVSPARPAWGLACGRRGPGCPPRLRSRAPSSESGGNRGAVCQRDSPRQTADPEGPSWRSLRRPVCQLDPGRSACRLPSQAREQ